MPEEKIEWTEAMIRKSLLVHRPHISDFDDWYEDAVASLLETGRYEGRGIVLDLTIAEPWKRRA
jgi:hypothetical protein